MKHQLIFTLLILCFGCGQFTPYSPELRHVPLKALTNAQNDVLENNAAYLSADWPKEEWWEIFGDEQLNRLINLALDANPSLIIAETKVNIAAAEFRKEKAPLFPNFNASGDYTRIHNSKNGIFGLFPTFPLTYTQPEIALNFNYEFDFWKKHINLIVAAIDEVEARAAEAYLSRLILAISVADAYFKLQASAAREELAKELLRNRRDFIELTNLRSQHGLENDWIVNRAKTYKLIASQFYEEVSQDVLTNNNELQALLANDFSVPIIPIDLSNGINEPFPIPTNIPIELLAHRADVWAQKRRVEAAARLICVARANFYPNINLAGFIGLQSIFPSKFFSFNSTYGAFGPAFHLPIFDGGILDAEYDIRRQEYVMAVAQYDQLVLDAVKEVLNALAALQKSQELYLIAKSNDEVARNSLELAQKRLEHNLNSKLDVLSYENDMLQTRDIFLQALLSSAEARLSLIQALGGGSGDIYTICK